MKKAWETTKKAFKNFFYFISSKIFLKNFTAMLFVIVAFVAFLFGFTYLFSRHGKAIETPNLVGMNISEAMARYDNIRFHVDSLDAEDAITKERPPLLSILAQDPSPKSKIKKNRTVYVTVQQYNRTRKTVPKIWGRDVERAMKSLEEAKLQGTILRSIPDKAENTVLEVYVVNKSGDTTLLEPYKELKYAPSLEKGTMLYLVIASGMGENVSLPNCKCDTYDMARFKVEGYDLRVGTVIANANVLDSAAAYVYRQHPVFVDGRQVKKGQEVDLWLTKDAPDGCDVDADFITKPDTLVTIGGR
jgi:beta-lactam-binding protein with PASTA domain